MLDLSLSKLTRQLEVVTVVLPSLLTVLLASNAVGVAFAQPAAEPIAVSVCDGDDEWPPYSYFQRRGGIPTSKILGIVPTVLSELLQSSGFSIDLDKQISWPRCLEAVRSGKERQMALQAAWRGWSGLRLV